MLTVAGICGLPGATLRLFEGRAHALGGNTGFGERAGDDGDKFLAADPADDVVGAHGLVGPLWRTDPTRHRRIYARSGR